MTTVALTKFISSLFARKTGDAERNKIASLEKAIGYTFTDFSLIKKALTHKSFVNERQLSPLDQNERLEFLGDAVLELAMSTLLMKAHPSATEGDLSKLRAAIVNEEVLSERAREIGLGDYLFLGRGEEQCQGREKASLLADAFEAVLGAVYLDSGYRRVLNVIEKLFGIILRRATTEDIIRDYKTRLQEVSQGLFRVPPRYRIVSDAGPDHDKTFEVHLLINEEIYGRGTGKSKKQAEQIAAAEALERIEKERA